jgi:polysaccharide export outer membrane protein
LLILAICPITVASAQQGAELTEAASAVPLLQLGPGDAVQISVYGQPDLGATVYVADDGTVPVALAGAVKVGGLSPADAARRIEDALRNGKFVNDPHVTITVSQSRSQRVSVLGEVGTPGRYAIDSHTTVLDLLAQAGGTRDTGSDTLYLVRTGADGKSTRYPISLRGLSDVGSALPSQYLQGGDVIVVPKAEQFYLYGEVKTPGVYRFEANTTLEQAITRAGGLTPQGSARRIEVKRTHAGKEVVTGMKLDDIVQPNDVIRVKESIF